MSKAVMGMLAGLLVCGAIAAAEEPQGDISIFYSEDGKTVRAIPVSKIISEDYLEVKYDIKGTVLKKPSYQVKEIVRAGACGEYTNALERMQTGKYRAAARDFYNAMKNMSAQPWSVEYCNYGLGNALYEGREFKGFQGQSGITYEPASVYFRNALAANPKSRFLPDIYAKLPECLLGEEKFDEAEKAAKEAEQRLSEYANEVLKAFNYRNAAGKSLAQLALFNARLAEARAEKGKGDWQVAADKYQNAMGVKTNEYPELRAQALEGYLRVLLAMKNYAAAETEATGIIEKFGKESDPKLIAQLPGAYYVRGQAYLMRAIEADGKNQKPQACEMYFKARWDFIRILAQFDNEDFAAKSFYAAGLCCDKLREAEPADAGEKAVHYWKAVISNFPNNKEMVALAQKAIERVSPESAPVTRPKPR
jgi:tetratricopeptide (TPR) repeat protein